jgi:two-component system phosphate regulon sensor histidine kinase PhoR
MRRYHTFWKLFLGNLLVVVVVVVVVGVLAYQRLDDNYQRRTRDDQDRLTHIVAEHFQDLWPLEGGRIDRMCKSMLRGAAAQASQPAAPSASGLADLEAAEAGLAGRLTVVAADGNVLGDSDADPAGMVNHRTRSRPEILRALEEGQTGDNVRYSETTGTNYRYVAVPVSYGGRTVAAVRLAVPVQTVLQGEEFFRSALVASAFGAVLVAALLGLLASWIWAAPIGRASMVARQIAAGDFSKGLRVEGTGELADLARAMNEMRDSLVGQIRITRAQQQNLQSVLTSLREGIVAVRADGTVALLNRAAAKLLSVKADEAVGKRLEAVLPSLDIYNLYQDAVRQQRPAGAAANAPLRAPQGAQPAPGGAAQAGEADERGPVGVELDKDGARRILDVQAVLAASEASDIRAILVLRDITELANAAAMKSQFVANASHELRTPLATVRAAVDALRDADLSDQEALKKCMDILDRHVKRLEALTSDLLDLHMVESGKLPFRMGELRLGALADRVRAEFGARAAEKGLQLTVDARPAEHALRADRALVELILRNLVDNAMKFTPAGGTVECTLEAAPSAGIGAAGQGGEAGSQGGAGPAEAGAQGAGAGQGSAGGAVLRVRDTGMGISRQDQARVFERFFQVDAARTGDARLRGTGLGLAIVKHAAERLGAKLELQSILGKGTTITVTLPASAPQ